MNPAPPATELVLERGSTRDADVSSTGQQEPLWPSIAFGAAGNAYLWWRRARQLGEGASLRNAQAWLRRCDGAVATDYEAEALDLRHTLCFGEAGVALVRALVAHASGDSLAYEEAFALFAARCSDVDGIADEFLFGSAGLLHGVRSLMRHTGDVRARQIGDGLAGRLLARVRAGASSGRDEMSDGFGHGAAGMLHALMSWSSCVGEPPSDALLALIEAHEDDRAPRRSPAVSRALQSGWCSGAAGKTLLWVRAYELTRAPSARLRARRHAAMVAACTIAVNADLCCGVAGRVFALLAMDRVEPGRGWLEHAHRQLALVGHGELERMRPLGLYKGLPGLACAAADAAAAPTRRMGFPLIED